MRRKQHKRIGAFVIAAALLFAQFMIPATEVKAAAADDNRIVRVACGMNDALYLDEDGDAAGICLPYLQQLAWSCNWTLEYVEGSYNESIQNLYDGKVDIMFPVGEEEDSEGLLAFSEFIGGYQQIGLFAKEDAQIFYNDYEGFDGKRVGLSLGGNSNILDEYATEHNFSYEAVPLNSTQDKITALMNGDVDLVAFSTLNTVPGGKLVSVLDQLPFHFCTRKDNPELMQELNAGMSTMMVNTPDVVSTMYQNVLKGYNTVSFTREENDKIQNTDKVVFGIYGDRLPLAGVGSNGESVGIYADILREVAAQSGLNIEIKAIEDSNKLYSYMDDDTVDFVIGIKDLRYSSENADNYLMSNSITEYTTVAVSMPEYQFDEDEEPVIALTRDRNYLESYISTNIKNAVINYYDTRKECLNAVQKGNADATFLNTWEYNYESKNTRFQDMMEWESYRIISNVAMGATQESDLEIMSIFEKTISQIPPERMSDIIASNLNSPYESYDLYDRFYEVKDEVYVITLIVFVLLVCFIIYMQAKKKYIQQLVVANRVKSDFLSRMSHELRTPLNAIDGYATLSSQKAETGEVEPVELMDNMASIHAASDYLLGIIKDILDVQRMETGKITLNPLEINPTKYMHTVVKMIQPMADEKHIKFTYDMLNGAKDNYLLDELRVQQVLFNILYNAVKFTPEGGSVHMTSDIIDKGEKNVTIRFVVADTGIGMSEEFVNNRLFHKFAQENQDLTSPYAGCGNGLAICKELVELMGGEIHCESKQGEGTTFTVMIRAEYVEQELTEEELLTQQIPETEQSAPSHRDQQQGTRRRAHKPRVTYDLSGVRVLMCEDNPMNQDMTKRLLERMNCQIDIAEDGQIGVDIFAGSDVGYYNMILMDIRMPNMDGLEATRMIRGMDRADAKSIPILAVSANAFEEDIKTSLESGMNEHLSKPVDARILYEKIKEYVANIDE